MNAPASTPSTPRRIAIAALSAAATMTAFALATSPALAVEIAPPTPAINTIERITATNTIRIGHREAAIPFSYVDPATKKPIGYAIDLCNKVVAAAKRELKLPNLKVEYVQLAAADRIPALLDGRIDLECGNTTNTKERREKVAFTVPHFLTGAKMLAKKSSGIDSLDELEGKKVAVAKGTTAEGLIKAYNASARKAIEVVQVKDNAEAFANVNQDKANAWMTDDILLLSYKANSDKPEDWMLNARMLSVEPLAIAMRKDPAWQKLVDTTVSRVIIDGEITGLYHKWFLQPTPPKNVTLNIPMSQVLRASFLAPSPDAQF
ncbi:MAG: amino acid ABC transporter substrate-binding protein [Burkholderiaceae bacterium]